MSSMSELNSLATGPEHAVAVTPSLSAGARRKNKKPIRASWVIEMEEDEEEDDDEEPELRLQGPPTPAYPGGYVYGPPLQLDFDRIGSPESFTPQPRKLVYTKSEEQSSSEEEEWGKTTSTRKRPVTVAVGVQASTLSDGTVRFQARIGRGGKMFNLGTFSTLQEASAAYVKAKKIGSIEEQSEAPATYVGKAKEIVSNCIVDEQVRLSQY
jgi:hypothetical protein